MTTEIELTVMEGINPHGDLQARLKVFEERHNVSVRLTLLSWETAWADIAAYGRNRQGPDVSEIGNTWLGSLVDMGSIRPFDGSEIESLWAGGRVFLPSIWQACMLGGNLYAIPWFADVRLVYYRKDVFKRLGIDSAQAFENFENLEAAIDKLKTANVEGPWLVPTYRTLNNLHIASSWVWGFGGDFLNPETLAYEYTRPESLQGFVHYFRMGRFISPRMFGLGDNYLNSRFRSGKAAVLVSGPWVGVGGLSQFGNANTASPDVIAHHGVSPLPGIPYVGNSSLVVWKHSQQNELAVKLVEFLSSEEFQRSFYPVSRMFPTRLDVLNSVEPVGYHETWQAGVRSLQNGRVFPTLPRWAILEDRLSQALALIWRQVGSDPWIDLEKVVHDSLVGLMDSI